MITKESLDIVEKITKQVPSFHHHYHILYDLSKLIEKNIINYLEIGCYSGASSILMLHNPKVKIVSVDIGYPIEEKNVINNIKKFFNDERFIFIKGSSQDKETKEKILNIMNNVDILFIDGNHDYDAVIKDFNMYVELVNKNGYIIFDDYHCPICVEVKPAVNEIINKLDKTNFNIIGTYQNIFNAYPEKMKENNCFIIQKK